MSLAAACLTLGMLVTVAKPAAGGDGAARDSDVGQRTIERLEAERRSLRLQVQSLQQQVATLQRFASARSDSLRDVSDELERLRLVAGLTTVRGPGIRVTLSDSSRAPLPSEAVANFLIQDYHLRDVVSVLFESGAEAVSINGERIVNGSTIFALGGTILVNGSRLAPPYEVRAIGPEDTLFQLLSNPGTLFQLREAVQRYGVGLRIDRAPDIEIPQFRGGITFRSAVIGGFPEE